MRQRVTLASSIASAALLLSAGAAMAGGWATVTPDPATAGPVAGQTTTVGFTVLQHGRTPVGQGNVIVNAIGPDGQVLAYKARTEGKPGHWVVDVTLPTSGSWQWSVTMPDQLEVQTALEPLQVRAAAAAPAAGGSAVPFILAVGGGLLLAALVVLRGGMRTIASRALQRP